MRCFTAAAVLFAAGLVLTGSARAQQVSGEFTVANQWKNGIKLVRIQAVNQDFHEIAGSIDDSIASEVQPGAELKVRYKTGANAKWCNWKLSYTMASGGGGDSILDLCGKTRVVVSGDDPVFPHIATE